MYYFKVQAYKKISIEYAIIKKSEAKQVGISGIDGKAKRTITGKHVTTIPDAVLRGRRFIDEEDANCD